MVNDALCVYKYFDLWYYSLVTKKCPIRYLFSFSISCSYASLFPNAKKRHDFSRKLHKILYLLEIPQAQRLLFSDSSIGFTALLYFSHFMLFGCPNYTINEFKM